ncbi:MAG: hypothetical protein IJ740_08350 [Ruminococcus sp.]|nr:hypothetical protein [Ruminococcus sp.]
MNITYTHEPNETALLTVFVDGEPMAWIFENDGGGFELHDRFGIHPHSTLKSIIEMMEKIFN